jgi:hypothetical protein
MVVPQALGTAGCAGWEAGAQPFVLRFTLQGPEPPRVMGGSRYTAACSGGSNTHTAVLDKVLAAQSSTGGGVAMFAVPLAGGQTRCMTWEAAARQAFFEVWEYDESGEATQIGQHASQRTTTPHALMCATDLKPAHGITPHSHPATG